jgi:hypothetical protein
MAENWDMQSELKLTDGHGHGNMAQDDFLKGGCAIVYSSHTYPF